jgi:spheroidene monooxygenase
MGLARLSLRHEDQARFWKLCGSGTGHGFTPRPNWGVWSILAVWPDLATAEARVATSPVWQRWRARAQESWTVYMTPISARGTWAGANPFVPDSAPAIGPPATPSGPLAALTRATVKPSRALRFWNRVPGISDVIGTDPNVAFKIGIGEVPLLHQVTFSIWPDTASMAAFARGDGPHGRAIRAVREGNWFAEELYARFQLLGSEGTWQGRDPLAGLTLPLAA